MHVSFNNSSLLLTAEEVLTSELFSVFIVS